MQRRKASSSDIGEVPEPSSLSGSALGHASLEDVRIFRLCQPHTSFRIFTEAYGGKWWNGIDSTMSGT